MSDAETLQQQLMQGDQQALAEFFDLHRSKLRVAVFLRLDPRVRGQADSNRIDSFVYAIDAGHGPRQATVRTTAVAAN